jgi:hypothetical protein
MSDFQRGPRPSGGDTVESEVQRLLKEFHGKLPYSEVQKLKSKYNDKLVDGIQEAFASKLKHVQKSAEEFAKRVHEKYGSDYPMHKLLEKARKYKQKRNLSDGEFEEFRRAFERILANAPTYTKTEYSRPSTNLGRTLGTINIDPVEGLKVGEDDYAVLQDILKMHGANKITHNQVVLQSLTHDVSTWLTNAAAITYDPAKHNYMNAIHPVVFAMFATKIHLFEHRMILANLPNIIRARYNKESVQTKPDYELLYDLITDPNDVVCDRASPLKDLKNRCILQDALQRCVLNMRMQRLWEPCSAELAIAIESCRLMNVENPELLYSGDESVYFRRIINTFSLRPTVVRSDDSIALNQTSFQQITSVPTVSSLNIMTLRLPPKQDETSSIDVKAAMTQSQFFIENGRFVTKNQQVIYSRNVLLFNILRKYNRIFMNKLFAPFNFQNLPTSVSALEKINDTPVRADLQMEVGSSADLFHLRAALVSKMTPLPQGNGTTVDVVTGCISYVFDYGSTSAVARNIVKYDPYSVKQKDERPIIPVTSYEAEADDIQRRSTIYIYATHEDNAGADQLGIDF